MTYWKTLANLEWRLDMKRLLVALGIFASACGGSVPQTSPSPAPPSTPTLTRIISLSGPIAFGDVAIGSSKNVTLTIYNTGNSAMSFTGVVGGFADTSITPPTSGMIPAGGNYAMVFRFAPMSAGPRTGNIIINADFTSGTASTTMSGNGIAAAPPSATGTWTGRASGTNCRQTGGLGGVDYCHDNPNISGSMTMTFQQSVTGSVIGTATFIDYRATVNGSLNGNILQVSGTGTAGFLEYEYANWNTTLAGQSMNGRFVFRFSGGGGAVQWDMTLSNVTRTAP